MTERVPVRPLAILLLFGPRRVFARAWSTGDDAEEVVGARRSPAELVEAADGGELVLALDGTTVDEAAVPTGGVAPQGDVIPPSSISTS